MAQEVDGFAGEVPCESVPLYTHGREGAGSSNLRVRLNPALYTRSRVWSNICISTNELLRIYEKRSEDRDSIESP